MAEVTKVKDAPGHELRLTTAVIHGMGNAVREFGGGWRKRMFDCAITLLLAPVWIPVLLSCAALILLLEGRPVFYVSQRQIGIGRVHRIRKFRTMKRNADKLINRDTVPVTDTAFLNIPSNSPIYTPIGRIIERFALTELPQLLHVLSGKMSLIGSRPLPERVMEALRERYPDVESRFLTKAGLTGPVQLIGRNVLSDSDRLTLEAEYCRIVAGERYNLWLDLWLLFRTVFAVAGQRMTLTQVRQKMRRLTET